MDSPADSRERLHGRSTCAEQGRTQSDSRCITTRPSACEGRAVSYSPRSPQGVCSLRLFAVLSSSSPTLLERAHVLQVVSGQVSREPSLFSHGQAKSNHVYTWVYIIELFARSQALLHRNRFPMVVLKGAINTSNTQHLLFTSSAMIRFISLNLSVSESATALALRLPLFNYESYTLG